MSVIPDLEFWRRMCRSRAFDEECHRALENGRVTCFTYLSSGQESIAAAVSVVMEGTDIFCQHRNHAPYICFGGDVEKLRDELLGLSAGTTGGMGGDPCHHAPEVKLWGHIGLVGDHVPLAVGMAFATREPVVCFFGDAAPEEDVFWSAFGFAVTHKLPVLFLCEDNDLSVLTPVKDRRSWSAMEVASGYGVPSAGIEDDPWVIMDILKKWRNHLPAFLNIRCCRLYRHVGAGIDRPMEWDRMALTRKRLVESGPKEMAELTEDIEDGAVAEMSILWNLERKTE